MLLLPLRRLPKPQIYQPGDLLVNQAVAKRVVVEVFEFLYAYKIIFLRSELLVHLVGYLIIYCLVFFADDEVEGDFYAGVGVVCGVTLLIDFFAQFQLAPMLFTHIKEYEGGVNWHYLLLVRIIKIIIPRQVVLRHLRILLIHRRVLRLPVQVVLRLQEWLRHLAFFSIFEGEEGSCEARGSVF